MKQNPNFQKLGELAWKGEKIIIAKSGEPYLELIPHKGNDKPRKPGLLKGIIWMADDFESAPDEILELFE